jgi:parallel beta-helix repeat protein
MPIIKRLVAPLAMLVLLVAVAPAQAADITVFNTNNSGAGSLRSAMLSAEMDAARDTIGFAIAGQAPFTITPTTPLPTLSKPVTIDGYTQRGATPATANRQAKPAIEINASNVPRGLDIGGDEIEVRGLVIRNAQAHGIYLEGARNLIAGNHIGLNAEGTAARPNGQYGIEVFGSDNAIGGPRPADRNIISSNTQVEVRVSTGTGNVIEGNRIGTNTFGSLPLGSSSGVLVETSEHVLSDNLISGEFVGVEVWGDENTLSRNRIGTDAGGTREIHNSLGINIEGGDRNVIEDNLVSGNETGGIQLETGDDGPAEYNEVRGNLVGTDADGSARLGNGGAFGLDGVSIVRSAYNTVEGNVIAANAGDGVSIEADGADGNRVAGNRIGTDATGTLELGNEGDGVRIDGGDLNHVADANTIAHNDGNGVTVVSGEMNAILESSIYDNGDLAIDLADDGPTGNDFQDADVGANNLQNHPEVTAVTDKAVDWTLDAQPNDVYRLELYTNDGCPVGSGEGQTYLGSMNVWTDANGHAEGRRPAPVGGRPVSMTATRMSLVAQQPFPRSTSEFSPCAP